MTRLAFVDTETTGLDPERHEMWDLAIIVRDGPAGYNGEWEFRLPVDLAKATPAALRINRYYERRSSVVPAMRRPDTTSLSWAPGDLAGQVADLLDTAHIVGAVPSFDAAFIARWLRANGHAPTWHYHLVTVECLALGWLAGRCPFADRWTCWTLVLPWKSEELGKMIGAPPPVEEERHTAIGDARWAMRMYDAVMGS